MKIEATIMPEQFREIMEVMKLWNRECPDPFAGNSALEYIGQYPDGSEEYLPLLRIIDNEKIIFETASGLGRYTITPDLFVFEGRRNSWLTGSLVFGGRFIPGGGNWEKKRNGLGDRVDITVSAPITRHGCTALHFGLYDAELQTSRPDIPLDDLEE
jgi:hypothetical protein